MTRQAEYTTAFLNEFVTHVPDIDLKTALYLADVGREQSPDGDAAEDARSEADEWKAAA